MPALGGSSGCQLFPPSIPSPTESQHIRIVAAEPVQPSSAQPSRALRTRPGLAVHFCLLYLADGSTPSSLIQKCCSTVRGTPLDHTLFPCEHLGQVLHCSVQGVGWKGSHHKPNCSVASCCSLGVPTNTGCCPLPYQFHTQPQLVNRVLFLTAESVCATPTWTKASGSDSSNLLLLDARQACTRDTCKAEQLVEPHTYTSSYRGTASHCARCSCRCSQPVGQLL